VPDFSNFVTLGQTQNKTSQDSIIFTVGSTGAAAGALLLVLIGSDNIETSDTEDGTDIVSVTDSKGNTYTKAKTFTNGEGAIRDGATVGIATSVLASELVLNDTITVTFSEAVTAKAMSVARVEIVAGKDVTVGGSAVRADDATDPGEISISGLTSREYLFVYGIAREGALIGITHDSDYDPFSSAGTGGGASNTNIALAGASRFLTGTGDAVDVTWGAADYAQALVAFYLDEPAAPAEPSTPITYQFQSDPVKDFTLGVEG
jgi:hypothetical protein